MGDRGGRAADSQNLALSNPPAASTRTEPTGPQSLLCLEGKEGRQRAPHRAPMPGPTPQQRKRPVQWRRTFIQGMASETPLLVEVLSACLCILPGPCRRRGEAWCRWACRGAGHGHAHPPRPLAEPGAAERALLHSAPLLRMPLHGRPSRLPLPCLRAEELPRLLAGPALPLSRLWVPPWPRPPEPPPPVSGFPTQSSSLFA